MKKTSLYAEHEKLGARMVPFAGYLMPVQYTGINLEHEAVRKAAGMFDVSHMGEFIVKGAAAEDFLQTLTSNDLKRIGDGKAQYSCLPNLKGGIIDDLLVYRIDAETFMLVVNASNIEKDLAWIQQAQAADGRWSGVSIKDISERTALLAVQGPKAGAVLQKLSSLDLHTLSYYSFKKDKLAGVDNVLVSATGYTGAGGFELYFDAVHAPLIWNAILEAGKSEGLVPAGLGARDTLRLEMGFCLYGNDIDEHTSPLEAGLGWITRLDKTFSSSEIFKKQKAEGLGKRLVAFEMQGRGIPRQGYQISSSSGEPIGSVTSGTQSPSLSKGIGLGYVSVPHHEPGSTIHIIIREQPVEAKIVSLPFYQK